MKHIAVDLGASNGRVIVASAPDLVEDDRPASEAEIDVCHRFPSHTLTKEDGLHWDIRRIFEDMLTGLEIAFSRYGDELASIAVDGWGVDFAILDSAGQLMFEPFHYRDKRTDGVPERFFRRMSARRLFAETGVQMMQLNTVFQLAAMTEGGFAPPEGSRYLSVPDLLSYWLCGTMINERTHASTTSMLNPVSGRWSPEVLDCLGLSPALFSVPTPSGTIIGELLPQIRSRVKAPAGVRVVASASHDTQSAAYLAGNRGDRAFLSCGTWSVLGQERVSALLSDEAYEQDFSNEASGYGGYNLLKNIMGLWILQECKAEWDQRFGNASPGYAELAQAAAEVRTSVPLIDVNAPIFLGASQQAGSMVQRINNHLEENGHQCIDEPPMLARVVIESLAEYYAKSCRQFEQVSGQKLKEILFVGGGAKNRLLSQLTAERTGLKVIIGQSEASALGNIAIQHRALA